MAVLFRELNFYNLDTGHHNLYIYLTFSYTTKGKSQLVQPGLPVTEVRLVWINKKSRTYKATWNWPKSRQRYNLQEL